MSRPGTPPRLATRGSFASLSGYRSGDVSTLNSPTEKERMKAEEEVRQALLKAQDGADKAKKEEPGVPVGSPGELAQRLYPK